MSIEIEDSLSVDFIKPRYVSINAKQYDKDVRKICVSCYANGRYIKIGNSYNYAYLRFRRSDGKCIFSSCVITKEGKVQFKLNKPMLDIAGKHWADIVLIAVDKQIAENSFGIFVVGNSDNSNELTYYPLPIVESDDNGNIVVNSVMDNGEISMLNQDPSPFVTDDGNGNVVIASILDSGEIVIEEAGIVSTMPFCVNVIKSAYFEENTGFIV